MFNFIRFITIHNTQVSVLVQSVGALEENPTGIVSLPEITVKDAPEALDRNPVPESAILDAVNPDEVKALAAEALPPLPTLQVRRVPILRIWFTGGGYLDVQGTREDFMRKLRIIFEKMGGTHKITDPPLVTPVKAGQVPGVKGN